MFSNIDKLQKCNTEIVSKGFKHEMMLWLFQACLGLAACRAGHTNFLMDGQLWEVLEGEDGRLEGIDIAIHFKK